MKALKYIAVAASVLMLLACGAPPPKPEPAPQAVIPPPKKLNPDDSQAVAEASSIQRDEYNKTTRYKGPNVASKPLDQLFIQARKSDAGSVTYQVYVVINYSGVWRFYNRGYDTRSNTLDLAVMTRNLDKCQRDDCRHNEHLVFDVTQKYLEEHRQSGLRFRVSAKAGEEQEFYISPGYIKAFLSLTENSR